MITVKSVYRKFQNLNKQALFELKKRKIKNFKGDPNDKLTKLIVEFLKILLDWQFPLSI
jgi:hypothetical protein